MTAFPILIMMGLIPLVRNDYLLAGIYLAIIAVSAARYTKQDVAFLWFGFFALLVSEYLFISTGVERFERTSFLGIMPVWLPLLWAYVFVAIKHSVELFAKYDR